MVVPWSRAAEAASVRLPGQARCREPALPRRALVWEAQWVPVRLAHALLVALALLLTAAASASASSPPECWNADVAARPGLERAYSLPCWRMTSGEVVAGPSGGTLTQLEVDSAADEVRFHYEPDAGTTDDDAATLRLTGPAGSTDVTVAIDVVPLSQNSPPHCDPVDEAQRSDGADPVTLSFHVFCWDPDRDSMTVEGGGPGQHLDSPTVIAGGHNSVEAPFGATAPPPRTAPRTRRSGRPTTRARAPPTPPSGCGSARPSTGRPPAGRTPRSAPATRGRSTCVPARPAASGSSAPTRTPTWSPRASVRRPRAGGSPRSPPGTSSAGGGAPSGGSTGPTSRTRRRSRRTASRSSRPGAPELRTARRASRSRRPSRAPAGAAAAGRASAAPRARR